MQTKQPFTRRVVRPSRWTGLEQHRWAGTKQSRTLGEKGTPYLLGVFARVAGDGRYLEKAAHENVARRCPAVRGCDHGGAVDVERDGKPQNTQGLEQVCFWAALQGKPPQTEAPVALSSSVFLRLHKPDVVWLGEWRQEISRLLPVVSNAVFLPRPNGQLREET